MNGTFVTKHWSWKKFFIRLGMIIGIILASVYFGWLGLIGFFLILYTYQLYTGTKLITVLKSIAVLAILFTAVYFVGGILSGIVALIALSVMFGAWRIYAQRDMFMDCIREIERMVWGKTKEEMKPGEKRPKVKLKWTKK